MRRVGAAHAGRHGNTFSTRDVEKAAGVVTRARYWIRLTNGRPPWAWAHSLIVSS